jgi:sulfite exporter TauE/SafE
MDISIILIILTGLGLGLGHSLDPDHIVAVSTLLSNNKSVRKSIISATLWGVGHSTALFLVGLCVLIFKIVIPDIAINLFEFLAGAMLVILGIFVVMPLIKEKNSHIKIFPENAPSNLHTKSNGNSKKENKHLNKSAVAGVLQGLGGSAALMLITLTTVSSVKIGLIFILIFGLGVILGMIGVSCVVGTVIAYAASNLERIHKIIQGITGTGSIFFGIFIILNLLI